MDGTAKLIVSDPKAMMGKPVISGTHITVELVPEKLAAGEIIEQLFDAPLADPRSHPSGTGVCCRGTAR